MMTYNNIVDGSHQTTGASSPLTAIDIRRWLLIYGICRGMGRVTAIDPAEQIAACRYCQNSTSKWQIKLPMLVGPVLRMFLGA